MHHPNLEYSDFIWRRKPYKCHLISPYEPPPDRISDLDPLCGYPKSKLWIKKNELTLAALIKQGISTVEPIMESLIQLVFASDGRTPFPSRPGPTGPTAHGPDPGVWRGCRGSSCCPRPRQPPAVELFGESNMAIENP